MGAMDCVISLPARFVLNQGRISSHHLAYERFASHYLEVFDNLIILARVQNIEDNNSQPVDGKNVTVMRLPYYKGSLQFVLKLPAIHRRVHHFARNDKAAFILRVPNTISLMISDHLLRIQKPYGIEVVSDPHDVFAPGVVQHPLRPVFRWWFARNLRRQCADAAAVAYVTRETLQRRYPPALSAFSMPYSDVQLDDSAFVDDSRTYDEPPVPFTLAFVGSLAQMYKAPDVLIDAVSHCVAAGLDLRLVIIGDGKHRTELEARARAADLGDRVAFIGQIPAGGAVRVQLDQADLFVLPSRTEGLPRALIEAMARGLPCIGSTAGGIPELLPPEDMVTPGDVMALADKIMEVVANPARMEAMSVRNLRQSRDYHEDLLRTRRIEFYRYVREKTELWLKEGKP